MKSGRVVSALTSLAEQRLSLIRTHLNVATGYDRIEILLGQVSNAQATLTHTNEAAKAAKREYQAAVEHRGNAQNELIMLLQRKSSWTSSDSVNFAELVQRELTATSKEAEAKEAFQRAENAAQAALDGMTQTALTRYHEEQLWSDKMRALSTYVSAGLVGINTLLLMASVLVIEPYKRARMKDEVVLRLTEELQNEGSALDLLRRTHEELSRLSGTIASDGSECVVVNHPSGRGDSGSISSIEALTDAVLEGASDDGDDSRSVEITAAAGEASTQRGARGCSEGRGKHEPKDFPSGEAMLKEVQQMSDRDRGFAAAGVLVGGIVAAALVSLIHR